MALTAFEPLLSRALNPNSQRTRFCAWLTERPRTRLRTKNTMAESFPAFLRSLEKSIEPLESIAGVAPPFRDEDEVEETTAADLAFVLRDLRRAAAGARALITSTNLPEDSDDEGTQIIERTQLDDAAPPYPTRRSHRMRRRRRSETPRRSLTV